MNTYLTENICSCCFHEMSLTQTINIFHKPYKFHHLNKSKGQLNECDH